MGSGKYTVSRCVCVCVCAHFSPEILQAWDVKGLIQMHCHTDLDFFAYGKHMGFEQLCVRGLFCIFAYL